MLYYKFIGNNKGNYPYRLGLNTLKHNNETFDATEDCTSGGLYYTTLEHILEFLDYGDILCELSIPEDAQQVQVGNKFKSDKIVIHKMIKGGYYEVVKYLVSLGVDIHVHNDEVLRWAGANGHIDVVKYLASLGMEIHAVENDAVRWASANGHINVVKYLVSLGVDIHTRNDEAIRWASANGHIDVVKYLVSLGADIHASDDHAARCASENSHLEVMKYLVSLGADIHALDDVRNTTMRCNVRVGMGILTY